MLVAQTLTQRHRRKERADAAAARISEAASGGAAAGARAASGGSYAPVQLRDCSLEPDVPSERAASHVRAKSAQRRTGSEDAGAAQRIYPRRPPSMRSSDVSAIETEDGDAGGDDGRQMPRRARQKSPGIGRWLQNPLYWLQSSLQSGAAGGLADDEFPATERRGLPTPRRGSAVRSASTCGPQPAAR